MPNYVTNILVTTSKEVLEEKILNKNRVDFNKVIPRPKEYDTIEYGGSMTYKPEKNMYIFHDFIVEFKKSKSLEEFVQKIKAREELRPKILKAIGFDEDSLKFQTVASRAEEYIEVFIRTFFCYHKYGIADTNEWSRNNWGCKWNSEDSFLHENSSVAEFKTAWSIPYLVYKKLAEQDTQFAVLYADEDMGHNCGLLFFEKDNDGKLTCSVAFQDNLEFACKVRGMNLEDVVDDMEEVEEDDKLTKVEKELIDKLLNGDIKALDKIKELYL